MSNFIQLLRKSISELTRFPGFLLIGWLVVALSLPLINLFIGGPILLQGLALAILLQAAFVLNVLHRAWGWWGVLRTIAGVLLLVWAVQAIIIRSGLPYGDMQYTSIFQPQLLGIPVLIPLTWLMMLPPSWGVARLVTHKLGGCLSRLLFILISAIAFTAWMVCFDPLLSRLGIVQWAPLGNFFGIPGVHFVFWLFIAALVTFAIAPYRLPGASLVLVYAFTWLVELISLLVFGGLLVPALIGFGAMGGMLILAGIMTR